MGQGNRPKYDMDIVMRAVIRKLRGESQIDICRDIGIPEGTLWKWVRKYKKDVKDVQITTPK
jgi:transposase-like protein